MSWVEVAIAAEGAVGLLALGGCVWGAGRKFGNFETSLKSIDKKLNNHIVHEFGDIKESLGIMNAQLNYIRGKLNIGG